MTRKLENIINDNTLKAKDLFDLLKNDLKRDIADSEENSAYLKSVRKLLAKANITGQTSLAKKCIYHMYCIEKQEEMKKAGIKQFVHLEDIKEYIQKVEDKDVKIILLEDYPREIPDEVVEQIELYQELFTEMYVLYTDYTKEAPEEVQNKYIEKDPILFGSISDGNQDNFDGRMYFIYDWIDEYCDLTFDKLIQEYKDTTGNDIAYDLESADLEEIKKLSKLYNKDLSRASATLTINGNMSTMRAN